MIFKRRSIQVTSRTLDSTYRGLLASVARPALEVDNTIALRLLVL